MPVSEPCVVEVYMVILLAGNKAHKDPDKKGHIEKYAVGMVEFKKSSKLVVQV